MSDELRICITIGEVDVSVECPTRADGALPYAVSDLLRDAADQALRCYKESGIADFEVVDGADDPE